MNSGPLLTALAVAALAISNLSQAAAPSQQPLNIEELRSRLNLTPEQQAKIAPLAEQRRAKLQDIQSKLSSASSRRDKLGLMKEAKQVQDEFVGDVEPLLTADQQAEWQKIREEVRAQMRERVRNRQQTQ
jgi:hypothetical protein